MIPWGGTAQQCERCRAENDQRGAEFEPEHTQMGGSS